MTAIENIMKVSKAGVYTIQKVGDDEEKRFVDLNAFICEKEEEAEIEEKS